jgi:hypothetical protein
MAEQPEFLIMLLLSEANRAATTERPAQTVERRDQ